MLKSHLTLMTQASAAPIWKLYIPCGTQCMVKGPNFAFLGDFPKQSPSLARDNGFCGSTSTSVRQRTRQGTEWSRGGGPFKYKCPLTARQFLRTDLIPRRMSYSCGSQTWACIRIYWGCGGEACENTDRWVSLPGFSHSGCLGWGQMTCLSNKFPGEAAAAAAGMDTRL